MTNLKSGTEKAFDALNALFMCFVIVVMLFPFVNQIALSLSSNTAVLSGRVSLWPIGFNTVAYKEVLSDRRFSMAFFNSIYFTVIGTLLHVFMTALFAYPLSRRHLKGRNTILNILVFSMIFGTGGMIPNYLLIKSLGLVNTYWALWLPSAINIFQLMIIKNFFQQIPESLHESAEIDGARPIRIFFQIILPLSLPSVAAISLFAAVSYWNTFFSALIYLPGMEKRLLQVHLNEVMQNAIQAASPTGEGTGVNPNMLARDTVKAATLMCTTLPIVCVYPFLQKYFVKGVMVGAVKG